MTSAFKALVFDLGGVLLNWDRHNVSTLSSGQFRTIMNSTTWHDLDRGLVSLQTACEEFGRILGLEANVIEKALEEAQLSLTVNTPLVQTIHDLRASNPGLDIHVMSNISKEHFKLVKGLDLPWDSFTSVFASGIEGMRKPDLCSFQHVVKKTGFLPGEVVMIDDTVENICAARSIGMHGMLVDNQFTRSGAALRNLLQQPVPRAEAFLKSNAGKHHSVVEGHKEIILKDNFAQLMVWELTGDASIVYLRWPSGKVTGSPSGSNFEPNGVTVNREDVSKGFWNYFYEAPVLTAAEFPPDADTTSTAYLSLPAEYLSDITDMGLVLDAMAENVDRDGIMQTYFSADRPRTTPEVCCNILRMFHHYGHGSDPRILKTEQWVVECLKNKACLHGNRYYSTLEGFLYFVARLYAICSNPLKAQLEVVKDELRDRLNVPVNPLGLALRLAACQFADVEPSLYQRDLDLLMSLQDEDGGWPAGHFCCIGRTGARIGNRGLATALALKVIQHEAERKMEQL